LGTEQEIEVKKKKNGTHEFSSCVISYCPSKNKLEFPVKFPKIDDEVMKKLRRKILTLLEWWVFYPSYTYKTRDIFMFKLVFKFISQVISGKN